MALQLKYGKHSCLECLPHSLDSATESEGADLRPWLRLGRNLGYQLVLPFFRDALLVP